MNYVNFNQVLSNLGFDSFKHYRKSKLFRIIQYAIFHRDCNQCRCRECRNRATTVHFYNLSEKALKGESPHILLSLCQSCKDRIVYDGRRKRTFKEMQQETLKKILATDCQRGKSNPRIGWWFHNQKQANASVKEWIAQKKQKHGLS